MTTFPLLSKIHGVVSALNNRSASAINGRANYEGTQHVPEAQRHCEERDDGAT